MIKLKKQPVNKNYLAFFVAILMSSNLLATPGESKNSTADAAYFIHLDKSFYVNGEVIWYKLSMPADRQHQSAVIKMVLTDQKGQPLFYTFLKNKQDFSVSGYYKIPFDLPSDMYRMSFLATDAASGEQYLLAYANLPIYNDSEKVSADVVSSTLDMSASAGPVLDDLNVQIEFSTDTLRSRSEMQTTVAITDAEGRPVEAQVSIAVSDQALTNMKSFPYGAVIPGLAAPVAQALDTNIIIKAKLTDYNDQALTANVLGVLAPQQNRIYYTRTAAPGVVNLKLPDFYAQQPIQFLGFPDEEDSIRIELITEEALAAEGTLTYTTEILEYLELSRKRKKIFQLYTDLEFNLQPDVPEISPQVLKPERTVNVKDYEPFDNVYLFFKEILTPLVFRAVEDEVMEAKVFTDRGNRVYEMLPGAPLFIIDGQATRDGNYIAHMKTDLMETVEIFTDRSELRQQFNVMGRSGVVIIKTSSADITVPDPDADDIKIVQGLQAPVDFPAFAPEQFQDSQHRPFFRPQLYWNPNLKTNTKGRTSTSFYQSDARGDFQVRVFVRDEQGRVGYAERTYYAEW